MKKFIKNPWVLGIGTTVIGGVLLSLVLDWINDVDLLSTLKNVIAFIFDAITAFLNFELKVWWVLVAFALFVVILIVIAKVSDAKAKNNTPSFLNYTKDSVLGYTWEWEYKKGYDGKYSISNLHPVCSECGMILKQGYTLYGYGMQCLRCNTTQQWNGSLLDDVRMLIEDNIKKKYFQNR